jgi:hypothetical protein
VPGVASAGHVVFLQPAVNPPQPDGYAFLNLAPIFGASITTCHSLMETLVNRTRFAPAVFLATLSLAACSDTSPTDIPSRSYAAIGGQTFVANFDKGESVRLEATGQSPVYSNGAAVFVGGDRGYLRTIDSYGASQVRADVIVTVAGGTGPSGIAFIGLGGGAPGWFYGEPNGDGPTVYARILPNDFFGPDMQLTDATDGLQELEKSGGIGGTGTHRVRMTWTPTTGSLTFAIDQHYAAGAEFVADATLSRNVDAAVFAAGARIFIGGSGNVSFDRLQVVVSD